MESFHPTISIFEVQDKTVQSLIKEIREYLLAHPNATDSLEGVCNWWLRAQPHEVKKVQKALDELIDNKFLVEKSKGFGKKLYSLNKK